MVHRLTLRLFGRAGGNRFRPRMRRLPSGRYQVDVTALTPSGGRSKPHRVVIIV